MTDRSPGPNNRPGSQRLEDLLREARDASARAGSVLPGVERRIAGLVPRPAVPVWRWSLAAALLLAVIVGTLSRNRTADDEDSPSRFTLAPSAPALAESFRIEVDGVEVVEHASALVDHSTVAVVWSRSGERTSAEELRAATNRRHGKYRGRLLHRRELPDGRTLFCSVFRADAGVRPVLEPPMVSTLGSGGGVLSFSASPSPASPGGLTRALQGTGLDANDVLAELRTWSP